MAANKRTNEEWLELYRQQRGSGMTMKSWCTENGVNLYTMADRVSRLRKMGIIEEQRTISETWKGTKTEPQGWIEVREDKSLKNNDNISVKLGDFTIAVPSEFQDTAFIKVCRALMSLC